MIGAPCTDDGGGIGIENVGPGIDGEKQCNRNIHQTVEAAALAAAKAEAQIRLHLELGDYKVRW